MKISPLDIRKQDFNRTLRGYDADEVQAFLEMLSEQWQELLDERRRTDETVRDLRSKIEHYERVEEALQEALQTARRNAEKTVENAEREANAVRKEASADAKEIKADAKETRDRLKQEAAQLKGRRDQLVAQLRAFLTAEVELLARFDDNRADHADLPSPEAPSAKKKPLAAVEEAPEQTPSFEGETGQKPEAKSPSAEASTAAEDEAAARSAGADEKPPAEARSTEAPPAEAPDEPEAEDETAWIVNALFASGDEEREAAGHEDSAAGEAAATGTRPGDAAATTEEIEKIRRILNDMD